MEKSLLCAEIKSASWRVGQQGAAWARRTLVSLAVYFPPLSTGERMGDALCDFGCIGKRSRNAVSPRK